jgi:hypothetical protein
MKTTVEKWPHFKNRSKSVQHRILRLNPGDLEIGQRIRGAFLKPVSHRRAKRLFVGGKPSPAFHYVPGGKIWLKLLQGCYFSKKKTERT